MSHKHLNQKGITIIELIVYISLIVVANTLFSRFIVQVVQTSYRVIATKEVSQNARMILTRISYEIKTSKEIIGLTSDELRIRDKDGNELRFYLDSSDRKVYIDTGGNSEPISPDNIKVDNLAFTTTANSAIIINATLSTTQAGFFVQKNFSSTVVPRGLIY